MAAYRSSVEDQDLANVPSGQEATVYLQLVDTAGNLGASGPGMQYSILFEGGLSIYLPLVLRTP